MSSTLTLPAFILERGDLLTASLSDLGEQFALLADLAPHSLQFTLSSARACTGELEAVLGETLPDLDGEHAGAPGLVPYVLAVTGARLLGLARTVAYAAGPLEGAERLAVGSLAKQAEELAIEARSLSERASANIAYGLDSKAENEVSRPVARLDHRRADGGLTETEIPAEVAA